MHQQKKISYFKTGFAVAAVMAMSLSVVGGTASAASMKSSSKDKPATAVKHMKKESQAAIDLRIGLTFLLREHVTTNLTVNRAIVSGASEATITQGEDAQFANTAALAGAIEGIYGPAASVEFAELFNEHIVESNAIAMAIASGDEDARALADEELEEYLVDITKFFVATIDVLPYDVVFGLLEEHEALMNKSTEALESRNFGQSKKFEIQALKQITGVAEALASGIVATQPALF